MNFIERGVAHACRWLPMYSFVGALVALGVVCYLGGDDDPSAGSAVASVSPVTVEFTSTQVEAGEPFTVSMVITATETITDSTVRLAIPQALTITTAAPIGYQQDDSLIEWDEVILTATEAITYHVVVESAEDHYGTFRGGVIDNVLDEGVALQGAAEAYFEHKGGELKFSGTPLQDVEGTGLTQIWDMNPLEFAVGFNELPMQYDTVTVTVIVTNVATSGSISYDGDLSLPSGWTLVSPASATWSKSLGAGNRDVRIFVVQAGGDAGPWALGVDVADSASTGYLVNYLGEIDDSEEIPILIGIEPERYSTGSTSPLYSTGFDNHSIRVSSLLSCDISYKDLEGTFHGASFSLRDIYPESGYSLRNSVIALYIRPDDEDFTTDCPEEPLVYYTNASNGAFHFDDVPYIDGVFSIVAFATDGATPGDLGYSIKTYVVRGMTDETLGVVTAARAFGGLTSGTPPLCLLDPSTMCFPAIDRDCPIGTDCSALLALFIQSDVSSVAAPFAKVAFGSEGFDPTAGDMRLRAYYPTLISGNAKAVQPSTSKMYIANRGPDPQTLRHEYGHHLHRSLRGGELLSEVNCHFVEGFGHFMSGVTGPGSITNLTENGKRIPGSGHSCAGLTEFEVAAALGDLVDGENANDGTNGDFVSPVSWANLASVLNDDDPLCEEQFPFYWDDRGLPDADDVVTVFENVGISPQETCP